MIRRLARQLDKRKFNYYIEKDDIFDNFALTLSNTLAYNELVKNFTSSIVKEKNKNNPEFIFF